MTDQLTAAERTVTPDCLVDLAIAWTHRPLGGLTMEERSAAIDEVCLLISQMRHREPKLADIERRRWIERVTARLCAQCLGMAGYEGAIITQLEQRVTVEMLRYLDWREKIAPVVERQIKQ